MECACKTGSSLVIVRASGICSRGKGDQCTDKCIDGYVCERKGGSFRICVPMIGTECTESECQSGALCIRVKGQDVGVCTACNEQCITCHDTLGVCTSCADGYKEEVIRNYTDGRVKCEKAGLPLAVIIGIAVGIAVVLALIGGVTAYFVCKAKKNKGSFASYVGRTIQTATA